MTKIIKCAFCDGMGKDPFTLYSSQSACKVCNGMGRIIAEEPLEKCTFCSGSGRNPVINWVPCLICGGTGNNRVRRKTKSVHCGKVIGGVWVTYSFN